MTPYPRYVHDWTPEHKEAAIRFYMTETLPALRKRQLINQAQTEYVYRNRGKSGQENSEQVMLSLQTMADLLAAAVDRKEFPEHQANPLAPHVVHGG